MSYINNWRRMPDPEPEPETFLDKLAIFGIILLNVVVFVFVIVIAVPLAMLYLTGCAMVTKLMKDV